MAKNWAMMTGQPTIAMGGMGRTWQKIGTGPWSHFLACLGIVSIVVRVEIILGGCKRCHSSRCGRRRKS